MSTVQSKQVHSMFSALNNYKNEPNISMSVVNSLHLKFQLQLTTYLVKMFITDLSIERNKFLMEN